MFGLAPLLVIVVLGKKNALCVINFDFFQIV